MLMSVGSSTSCMPVIELTVVPPSLIASLAMCECASMMPGETNLSGDVDRPRRRPESSTFGADRGDLAVAQHDRAVRDGALRHGHHRPARAARRRAPPRSAGLALNPVTGQRHEYQQGTQCQELHAPAGSREHCEKISAAHRANLQSEGGRISKRV